MSQIFGVVHGPQSLKPFAFSPREPLLQIERTRDGFAAHPKLPQAEKVAVLGARACDLAGLATQDRIFLNGAYQDPYYAARRDGLFVIAVNCTRALPTCFCASMDTGPWAKTGFDLALTEPHTSSEVGRLAAALDELADSLEHGRRKGTA